MSRE